MRKRIRQIARGKFENEAPALLFPEEELSITVTEGQEYTGEFKIISTNHVPVRGVVYTSSSRMECLLPQFEGEEVRIRFQFHSRGLEEGETEKGDFVIVCNQGVYSLSFCVSVSRLYAESSAGSFTITASVISLNPRKSRRQCFIREFWMQSHPGRTWRNS